jgi:hypothetical protein
MTNIHHEIFDKIKTMLKEYFKENLKEFEEGKYLTISDSGIWISVDDTELTIGYGLASRHYNTEYDDISTGIDSFYNLLTKRKKITRFFKGGFCYKTKIEVELRKDCYDYFGTLMTWLFPFWKTTTTEIKFEDKFINSLEFENSITAIINYIQLTLGKKAGTVY